MNQKLIENPLQPLEQTRADILTIFCTWLILGEVKLENETFAFGEKAYGFVAAVYMSEGHGFEFLFSPAEIQHVMLQPWM